MAKNNRRTEINNERREEENKRNGRRRYKIKRIIEWTTDDKQLEIITSSPQPRLMGQIGRQTQHGVQLRTEEYRPCWHSWLVYPLSNQTATRHFVDRKEDLWSNVIRIGIVFRTTAKRT